jgi:hypothetical protein
MGSIPSPTHLHTYADSHTGSTKSDTQQLSLGALPAPPQVPSDRWTPPLPAALPPQWHASSTVTQVPNTTLQDCPNTHTALALLQSGAARTLGASYDCCAATALTLDACCRPFQPLQPVHLLEQQLSARLPHESSHHKTMQARPASPHTKQADSSRRVLQWHCWNLPQVPSAGPPLGTAARLPHAPTHQTS